jgi:adenylate cyclase
MGEAFFQTIKSDGSLTRTEVEIEISKEQFDSLWGATEDKRVEKIRYEIPLEEHTIELDVYDGELKGLVIAEVEFVSVEESARFVPPDWFDKEVTYDKKFRNRNLANKNKATGYET